MPKSSLPLLTVAATAILASVSGADILEVTDTISIAGQAITTTDGVTSDIIRTDADGNIDTTTSLYDPINQNPGNVGTYQYGIRERIGFGQPERRWRSFLQFDVSTIPAADLANPNFTANFTVDYVTHLNNLNSGLNVGLGQIIEGPWDSTTTLPAITLSESSTDLGILITDAAANPTAIPGLSVDITDLVKGWADGSIDNFGLTFTVPLGDPGVPNGTYFNNATIVTSTDSQLGDEIEVTNITRATDGSVTLSFISPVGNVDVYRSTDLLDFGATPIASDIAPGNFVDNNATELAKAFYILVPTGVAFP